MNNLIEEYSECLNKFGTPGQSMREEAENYRNNSPTTLRIQIKADNTTMTKDAWRNCYLLHSKVQYWCTHFLLSVLGFGDFGKNR